jgi:hypothetical protein
MGALAWCGLTIALIVSSVEYPIMREANVFWIGRVWASVPPEIDAKFSSPPRRFVSERIIIFDPSPKKDSALQRNSHPYYVYGDNECFALYHASRADVDLNRHGARAPIIREPEFFRGSSLLKNNQLQCVTLFYSTRA